MKRTTLFAFGAVMLAIVFSACETQNEQTYETQWAGDDLQEIISNLESQHGGFDITMMQTSYRYNELYWAGQDENWGYADYQLHEMLEGLEDGFVRRPEREASAAQFVDQAAPRLLQAIEAGDQTQFLESFNRFASACNTCHTMEEMPFIQVIIPEIRTSLVKF